MSRSAQKLIVVALFSTAVSSAIAAPTLSSFAANGSLSEWGVASDFSNLQNNAGNQCTASAIASIGATFACERYAGTDNTGYLGPQYGGQNYDVAFMGLATNSARNALYFGLVSGQRPDNGMNSYSPGDLFFKLNGVNYVIEMAGGAGHSGAGLAAQTLGATGSTYTLNGQGYTSNVANPVNANQTFGSIWRVTDGTTRTGVLNSSNTGRPIQFEASANASQVGTATAAYSTRDSLSGQYATYELSLDLMTFGLGGLGAQVSAVEAYWGPSCYNDYLEQSIEFARPSNQTPEPGTLALFGAALAGLLARRKRA